MSRIVRFVALITLFALVTALSVFPGQFAAAQQDTAPRYLVNRIDSRVLEAENRLEVDISVANVGGNATEPVIIELVVAEGPANLRAVTSAQVNPLNFGGQQRIALETSLAGFAPGSRQVFTFRVTNTNGQPVDFAPPAEFAVTIPGQGSGAVTPQATPAIQVTPQPEQTAVPNDPNAPILIRIPLPGETDLLLDLGTRQQLALTIGAVVAGLMILWLLTVLLRLLFRRPPSFGNQLPPYANMPPLHPQSTAGIRQAWQQVAMNNAITVPPAPGAAHAVKRLIGSDGQYLSGWRITALRMSQYDQYGRVARSQHIASRKVVNQLARLARKSQQLDSKRLHRRTRPLGNALAKQFIKGVTKRSAMLPIALDIRLLGTHGEVNIVFEVYGNQGGVWQLLDQWLPDMTVTGKTIYESYTYTIYGQTGGESWREFRRRLPVDIARVLALFIEAKPFDLVKPEPKETQTQHKTEEQPSLYAPSTDKNARVPERSIEPTPDRAAPVPQDDDLNRSPSTETAANLPAAVIAPEPAPSSSSLHETNPQPFEDGTQDNL